VRPARYPAVWMTIASPGRARVLLLIPHLGGGGAERIAANLARHLSPIRYEVHLGLVTESFQASKDVASLNTVHALGARRVRTSSWKLLRLVWHIRPAVILSGMAHLNLLVLVLRHLFPSRTCVLVRQNGALSATLATWRNLGLARRIYAVAYRRADRVICQTRQMAKELQSELGVDSAKLIVLPNPVDIPEILASAAGTDDALPSTGLHLLAVARLAPEKGIDLLLEAFAGVRRRFPYAELRIAGSGGERPALLTQCKMLGIEGRVKFLGYVAEPASLFDFTSLFVLSSRQEGMPNAMLEAAAAGLPIVALPASQGLVELLGGQPGIWLASEVSAKALENALYDALSTIHAGQRFRHSWIEPFDLKNAIPAYEDAIDQVLVDRES
jgi:glycosyltransferase involved in cell wall biosynthesis